MAQPTNQLLKPLDQSFSQIIPCSLSSLQNTIISKALSEYKINQVLTIQNINSLILITGNNMAASLALPMWSAVIPIKPLQSSLVKNNSYPHNYPTLLCASRRRIINLYEEKRKLYLSQFVVKHLSNWTARRARWGINEKIENNIISKNGVLWRGRSLDSS